VCRACTAPARTRRRAGFAAEHGPRPTGPRDQRLAAGLVFLLETSRARHLCRQAPTYDRAPELRLRHGDPPLPVEDDGMDVEALRARARPARPRLLHHPQLPEPSAPFGRCAGLWWSLRQASSYRGRPYGKLRFEGESCLGGRDRRPRCSFTSSFSKTVAPSVGRHMVARPTSPGAPAAAARTHISRHSPRRHPPARDRGHLPGHQRVTGLMRERRDAMMAGMWHMPRHRCVPPAEASSAG
jgi:hypothetical protein